MLEFLSEGWVRNEMNFQQDGYHQLWFKKRLDLHGLVTHIGTHRSSEMLWKLCEFFLRACSALHLQGRAGLQLTEGASRCELCEVCHSPIPSSSLSCSLWDFPSSRLPLRFLSAVKGKEKKCSSNISNAHFPWSQELCVTLSPCCCAELSIPLAVPFWQHTNPHLLAFWLTSAGAVSVLEWGMCSGYLMSGWSSQQGTMCHALHHLWTALGDALMRAWREGKKSFWVVANTSACLE